MSGNKSGFALSWFREKTVKSIVGVQGLFSTVNDFQQNVEVLKYNSRNTFNFSGPISVAAPSMRF